MPYPSERQAFLQKAEDTLAVALLDEQFLEDVSLVDSQEPFTEQDLIFGQDSDFFLEILLGAHALRYVTPHIPTPKTRAYMDNIFDLISDVDFQQQCRMTKESFQKIVELIKDHPIFHNNSFIEQTPVKLQLACALKHLGKNGNGASMGSLKRLYGIGYGTVSRFTDRVIKVLNDLAKDIIHWPSQEERAQIRDDLAPLGFPGCIGFIDGTTLPLSQRPGRCGEAYFDRKHRYSINAQVVCNHQQRFMALHVGFPGSC